MSFIENLVNLGVATFAGTTVGGTVITIGDTATIIYRLPQLYYNLVKDIIKSKNMGPNLKVTFSILSPLTIPLSPIITALGSFIWGFGYGFYKSMCERQIPINSFIEHIEKFNELIKDHLNSEDNSWDKLFSTPTDIKVAQSLRGLFCGLGLAPIESLAMYALIIHRCPEIVFYFYRVILRDILKADDLITALLYCSMLGIATVLLPFVIALFVVVMYMISIYSLTKKGYKLGVLETIKSIKADLLNTKSFISDFVAGMKKESLLQRSYKINNR